MIVYVVRDKYSTYGVFSDPVLAEQVRVIAERENALEGSNDPSVRVVEREMNVPSSIPQGSAYTCKAGYR